MKNGEPQIIATKIIRQRSVSTYEIVVGIISTVFTALCIAMIASGDGTLTVWIGLFLFGMGTAFLFKDLRAPKQELVFKSDRLIERVGGRILLDLKWSEIGRVETAGKNQNVTIYRCDQNGELLMLPEVPKETADREQYFVDMKAYDEELEGIKPALGLYGKDQRVIAHKVRAYKSQVNGRKK